ncbi:MAG TPA: 3'-5' exonuclease, partial [Thermoanaerobaculia bacterium]
ELGFARGRPRDLWRRVRFVIDQARAFAEAQGGGLREFLVWADLQSAEGARVVETVLPETDDDAVRILTVHGAKGLEFPITIVSGMTTAALGRQQGVRLVFPHDKPTWALKIGKHVTTEEFERYLPIDEQMDFHEKLRLLYVAATRARETLVVSTRSDSKKREWRGAWGPLGPFLLRELASPEARPISQREILAAASLDRERELARERRSERFRVSERPGYAAVTVTALAHAASSPERRPFASSTGKGMSWGSALHRLLEAAMRDPAVDLRLYAANVLAEEERPPEDLEEALETVEGVRRSALWKRALASRQCLVEVPFALSVPSADLGLPDGGPSETLLSGAIDLVFEDADGWTLVDYKSDTVAGNLDALVAFYTPQIEHYRRVWRDLTRRPTRAGLFFVHGAREVWLPD